MQTLESTSPLCWCFAKVICTFPIVLDTKVVKESLQGIQERKKKKRETQTWAANHKKKNLEVKVEIVDREVFPHVQ